MKKILYLCITMLLFLPVNVFALETQEAYIAFKNIQIMTGSTSMISVSQVSQGKEDDIVYTSRDENVAVIDIHGDIKAIAPGSTIIDVTIKGDDNYKPWHDEVNVTVKGYENVEIPENKVYEKLSIPAKYTFTPKATGYYHISGDNVRISEADQTIYGYNSSSETKEKAVYLKEGISYDVDFWSYGEFESIHIEKFTPYLRSVTQEKQGIQLDYPYLLHNPYDVSYYAIIRDDTVIAMINGNQDSYLDQTTVPDTSYTYGIAACDKDGKLLSNISNLETIKTAVIDKTPENKEEHKEETIKHEAVATGDDSRLLSYGLLLFIMLESLYVLKYKH